MTLTPTSAPPSCVARWCPRCCVWLEARARRRCPVCGAAVVRHTTAQKSLPGELRPGVVAEFDDVRDRYDAAPLLARLRARLQGRYEAAS